MLQVGTSFTPGRMSSHRGLRRAERTTKIHADDAGHGPGTRHRGGAGGGPGAAALARGRGRISGSAGGGPGAGAATSYNVLTTPAAGCCVRCGCELDGRLRGGAGGGLGAAAPARAGAEWAAALVEDQALTQLQATLR